MNQSVLFEVTNNVGWIRLNRPKVINSLNTEMVHLLYAKLEEWKEDQRVSFICISGEGEKGFCAGGDMKALYDLRDTHVLETAHDFFSTEYKMNILIHQYPKPVLVYMHGVVMGGGVGIAAGAVIRIVTEKTKWAMPEMNIGFYPDVGASYFLNKMPGATGRYLALTSQIIGPVDAIFSGAADTLFNHEDWENLKEEILQMDWKEQEVLPVLNNVITKYSQPIQPSVSTLGKSLDSINTHFRFNTIEEILSSLEKGEKEGDSWAKETRAVLLTKSPLSLKVTLKQLVDGETKSLIDCFKLEYILSMNFMKNPDFYEGVRSVLVDKDRSPKWNFSKFSMILDEDVNSFFIWDDPSMISRIFEK